MSEINPGIDQSNSYGTILCILDTRGVHSEMTRVYLKLLNPLLMVRYPQLSAGPANAKCPQLLHIRGNSSPKIFPIHGII